LTIKRFEAGNEEAAIKLAQTEFGEDALILKVRSKNPKWFLRLFKKPSVEVTAAIKETSPEEEKQSELFNAIMLKQRESEDKPEEDYILPPGFEGLGQKEAENESELESQRKKIEELESKINDTEFLLSKVTSRLTIANRQLKDKDRKYENNVLQLFYETLLSQGVADYIADELLNEVLNQVSEDEININLIVKIVYNSIIGILHPTEEPFDKKGSKKEAKVFAFIGPTGVGKTTTIAKLASILILKKNLKLGLVTADTYRIAAVEQLRTYGDILGIEVDAVYKHEELPKFVNKHKKVTDVILLDTAGRSHKNSENMKDIADLLSTIPKSDKLLVLSLTTKYETLMEVVKAYSDITDFNLIFTKADESEELGSILNICYLTGKKVSYITAGQNVPEDIELAKPEKIAKSLLGLGGDLL